MTTVLLVCAQSPVEVQFVEPKSTALASPLLSTYTRNLLCPMWPDGMIRSHFTLAVLASRFRGPLFVLLVFLVLGSVVVASDRTISSLLPKDSSLEMSSSSPSSYKAA